MKSQVNLALAATVGILVVIGVSSLSLVSQSQIVIKNLNERNIVESTNQMEFIKKAIQQSALYSTYQAAYTLSKYGGYDNYYGACDSSLISDYPTNLPYWRVFDSKCFPNPKNSVELKLKDIAFERFTENLESIRSKFDSKLVIPEYLGGTNEKCPIGYTYSAEKKTCVCDISEPTSLDDCPLGNEYYTKVQIYDDDTILVEIPATDKIKFVSETLELSDNVDVVRYIALPLGKLLNFAKMKFVNPDSNILNPLIEESNDEMNLVDYSAETTRNCKQITLSDPSNYCGKPVDKTKAQILSEECPNVLDKFEDKIINKINNYNLEPPSGIDTSLTTNRDNIKSSVDTDNEGTCTTNLIPNYCLNTNYNFAVNFFNYQLVFYNSFFRILTILQTRYTI